jgi:hypothetical protein
MRKQALMAGRILNRRELRQQAEQAEQPEQPAADVAAAPKKRVRAKAPAAARPKKARPKKVPPRMRARWGVFDGGMKQLAVFDYNRRAEAEEQVANLLTHKKGAYFLQLVKEPMPELQPTEIPPLAAGV